MFKNNELKKEVSDIQDILDIVGRDISLLKERRELSNDIGARVAELELKMAKLWSLLLETSQATGKEKLTKFGRRFGGKSRL